VATRLADRLCQELAGLAMPDARFEVEVVPGGLDELNETGLDQVRFLFSANPGEAVRPLARVASGGELSRVLLALKTVLAEVDPVAVYVFDEVDSGVGGAVAEVIGARLAGLAATHQVVCITHLPQIATHGLSHFTVRKRVLDGRTISGIERLASRRERVEEIARMLGGRQVTDKARSHARDLLARAHPGGPGSAE
jgi:DNA repair protein RecN (Recombination protein N)